MGGEKRKGASDVGQGRASHSHAKPHANQTQSLLGHDRVEKKQKVQVSHPSRGATHFQAQFELVASDMDHNSPSLLLNIDKLGKICFNAGEGLQRLMRENKMKMQKLDHYLFTRVHTSHLAGLPGMLLSTSTTGSDAGGLLKGSDVNVCLLAGPAGLGRYCDSFYPYINQEQTLRIIELPSPSPLPFKAIEQPVLQNDFVTVRSITVGVSSPPPDAWFSSATWTPSSDLTACYVCELAGLPGKFDVKKAQELNVPEGRMWGILQSGKEVTLPSLLPGDETMRVVKPEQVVGAAVLGPIAIVIDCPTIEHFESLTDESALDGGALDRWTKEEGGERHLVMFHFSHPSVFQSQKYQSWMKEKLGSRWNHVLCASGSKQSVSMKRATILQAKLNCFNTNVFPLLHHPSASSGLSDYHDIAPNGLKYRLMKNEGVDLKDVEAEPWAEQNISSVQDSFRALAGNVIKQAQSASKAAPGSTTPGLPIPEVLKNVGREEAEIVFLGTVSAVPSRYRNVTSIYVDRFKHGGLLLDCGEDTLGQLKRRYGSVEAERRLRELKCIWVSHMHADHHGGLYRLLQRRSEILAADAREAGLDGSAIAPILILAPIYLFDVLSSYRDILTMPFHFLPNHLITDGKGPVSLPATLPVNMYHEAIEKLDLAALRPVPVEHVSQAFGISIEGKSGWKVVFSGDTRPCTSLVNAAKDASLLIHEATFEDEMWEEARAKRHSTTGEAMSVGAQSGAYRTVLTHFSSRYPSLPKAFDAVARPDVAIAMDFMSINLADLEWLPGTVGPLDELFKREEASWAAEE